MLKTVSITDNNNNMQRQQQHEAIFPSLRGKGISLRESVSDSVVVCSHKHSTWSHLHVWQFSEFCIRWHSVEGKKETKNMGGNRQTVTTELECVPSSFHRVLWKDGAWCCWGGV